MANRSNYTLETLLARADADADCLLWTGFMQNGSVPMVKHQGKWWPVRKLVHNLLGNPEVRGGYWCAKCDRRRCVAPLHVEWRDTANHVDAMHEKMRRNPAIIALRSAKLGVSRRKLSDEQVLEMMRGGETCRQAAQRLGVSLATIKKYRRGRAGATLASNSWLSMLRLGGNP